MRPKSVRFLSGGWTGFLLAFLISRCPFWLFFNPNRVISFFYFNRVFFTCTVCTFLRKPGHPSFPGDEDYRQEDRKLGSWLRVWYGMVDLILFGLSVV